MNLALFLNDLSLVPHAANERAGRDRMTRFLQTIARIRAIVPSARPLLHVMEEINAVALAPAWTITDWLRVAEPDNRRRYLLLLAQPPLFLEARDPEEHIDRDLRREYRFRGQVAKGLGAAHTAGTLSVSFASDPSWEAPRIALDLEELTNAEQTTKTQVDAHHASCEAHVDANEALLRELERLSVKDGQDLWDRRADLFPALLFCRDVQRQLRAYDAGDPALDQIIKNLVILQYFFAEWDGTTLLGPTTLGVKCTPESESTLGQYAAEHTFTLPDGTSRLFSWHVRFTPGVGRIYFECDHARLKGVIGHIGRALPPH